MHLFPFDRDGSRPILGRIRCSDAARCRSEQIGRRRPGIARLVERGLVELQRSAPLARQNEARERRAIRRAADCVSTFWVRLVPAALRL